MVVMVMMIMMVMTMMIVMMIVMKCTPSQLLCMSTELIKVELDLFLTPHDLNRLEKYAQNMVDYHMVMDLLPTLARLYFTRRLNISLNELKSVRFAFSVAWRFLSLWLQYSCLGISIQLIKYPDSLICKGRETSVGHRLLDKVSCYTDICKAHSVSSQSEFELPKYYW